MGLRSRTKVKIKNAFTGITKMYDSPLYRGLRLWDKLPPELQKEKKNVIFKHKLQAVKI